jgi:hypothetical protein
MMAKQGTPKAAVAKQAAFYARAADLPAQTQRELDRVTGLSTSSRVAHGVGGTVAEFGCLRGSQQPRLELHRLLLSAVLIASAPSERTLAH